MRVSLEQKHLPRGPRSFPNLTMGNCSPGGDSGSALEALGTRQQNVGKSQQCELTSWEVWLQTKDPLDTLDLLRAWLKLQSMTALLIALGQDPGRACLGRGKALVLVCSVHLVHGRHNRNKTPNPVLQEGSLL